MTQQEFNQLLKRYLEGQTTEEEDQQLTAWYLEPANQIELPMTESQKKEIGKRMWRSIRRQVRPSARSGIVRLAWFSGIAACLILGLGWLYLPASWHTPTPVASVTSQETGIEVKNTHATEQEVRLPDGTTILLAPGSRLVYDKAFNLTRREVYLHGEAFFQVTRDATRPFVVHTGELDTEVLGTSFRIRQNEKTTEVSVRTGKVSVFARQGNQQRERNGVIITPNQRVVYDASTRNITTGIVEEPVSMLPREAIKAALVFREASFEKVLAELTRLYGIEFIISNSTVKDCHITADLNGLSLFTQLDLICKSIDASYEKRGTVVFINGEGC